ncbi:hypothetical protein VFC49_04370 [Thermococcus sp. SY098]|uniref:hypothetical protein n=1 Tax=Thermococcus sp. SY098 TaxID=3111325 RepID=UPI002D7A0513|nr:hypothetical protein [Thermococcus sp. SY098]WRS53355.1 hypothetical protein VFC49_04370 [Thermococcus sp. SY098]
MMGTKIKKRINELSKKLGKEFNVSPEELYTYLTAESYEDDKYTPGDILSNEYLLFHELVEIECLKKRGLEVTSNVIVENPETVYECHLKALEEELKFALKECNVEWIKKRLKDVESYLNDEYLPRNLRDEVVRILKEFAQ